MNFEGASSTITNSGEISGTTARAINIAGSSSTITNESGGTIQAGASTWDENDLFAILISANATNLTLENSGTITSGTETIKTVSTGMTLTNYSGGTISAQADASGLKAIFVDGDNLSLIHI